MFLSRPAFAAARRAAVSPMIKRSFTSSIVRSTTPPRSPILQSVLTGCYRRSSTYSRQRIQRGQDQEVPGYDTNSQLRESLLAEKGR